jgi:SPP1 family predicted phage head-tail adaptor
MIANFFDKTFSVYAMSPSVVFPYDPILTLVSTFAGCLEQLNGREVWQNGQVGIIVSHRIYCPYTTMITENQNVVYGTRTFDVQSIDSMETHSGHHKELLVKEVK